MNANVDRSCKQLTFIYICNFYLTLIFILTSCHLVSGNFTKISDDNSTLRVLNNLNTSNTLVSSEQFISRDDTNNHTNYVTVKEKISNNLTTHHTIAARFNVSSTIINDVPSNKSSTQLIASSSSSSSFILQVERGAFHDDSTDATIDMPLKSANQSIDSSNTTVVVISPVDCTQVYNKSVDISPPPPPAFTSLLSTSVNLTDDEIHIDNDNQQSLSVSGSSSELSLPQDGISSDASNIIASSSPTLLLLSSQLSYNITPNSHSTTSASSSSSSSSSTFTSSSSSAFTSSVSSLAKVASTLDVKSACDTLLCSCTFTRSIVSNVYFYLHLLLFLIFPSLLLLFFLKLHSTATCTVTFHLSSSLSLSISLTDACICLFYLCSPYYSCLVCLSSHHSSLSLSHSLSLVTSLAR